MVLYFSSLSMVAILGCESHSQAGLANRDLHGVARLLEHFHPRADIHLRHEPLLQHMQYAATAIIRVKNDIPEKTRVTW